MKENEGEMGYKHETYSHWVTKINVGNIYLASDFRKKSEVNMCTCNQDTSIHPLNRNLEKYSQFLDRGLKMQIA